VTTVTAGTSVSMDVEGVGSDVVLASGAATEGEAVGDVLSMGVLSVGKTMGDVVVLGGIGIGTAAENPIDEQRSKAAQRVIK